MLSTLLPPTNSLDNYDDSNEEAAEATVPITCHSAANSLVATGGTLSLIATNAVAIPDGNMMNVPTAASTTNNARNV